MREKGQVEGFFHFFLKLILISLPKIEIKNILFLFIYLFINLKKLKDMQGTLKTVFSKCLEAYSKEKRENGFLIGHLR